MKVKHIPKNRLDEICKEVAKDTKTLVDKILNCYIEEGITIDEAVERVTRKEKVTE